MKTSTRLVLYGLGLVVAFGAAFGIARVVVPESVVTDWTHSTTTDGHTPAPDHGSMDGHGSEGTR
ncbi:hypothetical protein ACL9RL_11310 [Plantibacter sp. Mn2098]|uniref:hypothetical protein n=1 Tax=Plantibacter sp. Mn2098 TaxID=3395266 RepID=UPI003BE449EB